MNILFISVPKIAWELAGGSVIRFKIILLKLWYFLLSRKLLGWSGDFQINGRLNKLPITFHLRYVMDIAVLREVFIEKEYEWCPIVNPKVIIDLGAHFGDTALYYAARFPEAKIIAVEPSPENFERLEKHTKNNKNIVRIQAAVGAEDGEIKLHMMKSSLGHSTIERAGMSEVISVPQISLASLFKKYDIEMADLIKFDIEGAEFNMLAKQSPEQFSKSYIGEVHVDLAPTKDVTINDFTLLFSNFTTKVVPLNEKRFIIQSLRADT